MNWFRENPFWSAFIVVAGGAVLVALGLLWWTKSSFEEAMATYRESAAEQTRLESGNPYPSQANVAKMKTYLDEYKSALDKLKAELKTHMVPEAPLAPQKPPTGPKLIEQRTVEVSLSASPSAGRKVINQISATNDQFFIVRAVYVKNQKDKGPPRENAGPSAPVSPPNPTGAAPAATPAGPLNFIVGNEHIDLSARVELVNFRL